MADWKELQGMPLEQRSKLKWNDQRILNYVSTVEQAFELPKNALRTLLYTENSYVDKNEGSVKINPNNDSTTTSKSKARGVMQFTDATMKLMKDRWKHNALDPLENIWFAADYFKHVLEKQYKGNIVAAIADYNGGYEQAKHVLKGKMPPSTQTADYLKKAEFHSTEFDKEDTTLSQSQKAPSVDSVDKNVPKNTVAQPEKVVESSPVETPVVAVSPKQERILSYDAGGRRLPSMAEK